ncbi:MAG TPA: lytic transglycosylase domain-containing protein [Rhizomicrobium sp.]|jgi:soluble lytic murein transglycosylase|nr:lytic transglycosylase domain-containing protein [Rhizomicrobium sp.]
MRLSTCMFAAFAVAAALGSAQAELPLPADGGAASSVPMAVLSAGDVSLYRQVFDAEHDGRFDEARDLFAKVSDTTLEGYVLAEHYLSPHGHATLDELVDWLHSYAELPIADRVYRLAVQRASKRVHKRHHKTVIVMTASVPVPAGPPRRRGGGYEEFGEPDPPLSSEPGRLAQGQIERDIKADQPDQANAVLRQAQQSGASDYDLARLAQRVSQSYLAEGEDQAAYDTSMGIQSGVRQAVPVLEWDAGFAAYRMGKYEDAAARFEILAQAASVPNYLRSQAAFWAARAHLRFGDPQRVITLLNAAAREEPTFYGVLAERMLGQDTQQGFVDPVLTASDFAAIMAVPAARRAVALTQVGEERASVPGELNRAFGASDGSHDVGYAVLARRMNVPNIELRASETAASRGVLLTGLFPVPGYKPDGGYTIDPALVLAFIRAESRFVADAVSGAGARGLMQLMPPTAARFGGSGAVSALSDPTYNMSIGQRYIAYLLDEYGGNLAQVPAAYNAGPLRLAGWINARAGKEDDALVFMESIRITETRIYVKRVLMYHWLYSRRLGEAAPSLDATAAGQWPVYHPPAQPPAPRPPAVDPAPSPAATVVSDARY